MAEEGTSVEEQVAKAQERAVQVLERFHATRAVQTEEALQGRAKAFAILKQLEAAVPNGSPNIEPAEYERRRRRSLMDLEQRKKRAMIKNLEYVAKLKIREHEAQLRKAEALHDAFQDSQDAHENDILIRARRQQLHRSEPSMAGIGSEEQRTAETKRRKFQEYAGGRTASNGTDRGTVAIYVSNLPTDGSTGEEALASVFGNLGYHLRKVHIYYNKQTGAMKGDALVIYQLGSGSNRNELTESVCTQMNGAEIAEGFAIGVEPSDSTYKLRKTNQLGAPDAGHDNTKNEISETTTTKKLDEKSEGLEDDLTGTQDEDLDDFFESLL